ncbi:MAG: ABC transporter permease [Lentisphaeria bacterium]|nr:ABC transporter permease [Lentisphaeria bacterium]
MKKIIASYASWIALLLLLILCAATCESFRIPANYIVMLRQACYTGIIAIGMTFVIGAGGIDLSVGSLFALSGVIAFKIAPFCCTSPAGQLLCLAAIALAAGAAGGALNGALAGFAKLPPFIVTLGTMSIFRSLALYLGDAGRVSLTNPLLTAIDSGATLWIFLFSGAAGSLILSRTVFGVRVRAVGSNKKVARFSGINTGLIQFKTYLLTGMLCALSALLWGGRLGGISSANDGTGYELDAIAAVIVGGSSMSGGKAAVTGTVAGILILTVISNALVAWGISPRLQECVKGAVIIIAVLSQYRKER